MYNWKQEDRDKINKKTFCFQYNFIVSQHSRNLTRSKKSITNKQQDQNWFWSMAKYYENSTHYNYNWDQVLQGFWKRYPNPYSSHVLSEDTVEREIRPDGKLYSKRILTKTNHVPKWGERFFKAKFVCIVEESLVDPETKTLTTYTRNIGFNKIMVCWLMKSFIDNALSTFCSHHYRASSRKLFTDQTHRARQSQAGQLGLTLKCLDLRQLFEPLAVKDSRRIAIRP